jgi:cytochrome c oxidase subunit 4
MINVVVALGIATLKASLVALFFMHLRYDRPLNGIIFVSSLVFLGIFLITCYTEQQSRDPLEPNNLKVVVPAPTGTAPSATPPGSPAPGATNQTAPAAPAHH